MISNKQEILNADQTKLVRIKYLLSTLESGRREVSDTDTFEDGVLSIGGEHIGWKGEWFLENPRYVSKEFYDTMSSGQIKKNDILFVKDGATIGKVAIAEEWDNKEGAVNEHVFILRLSNENYPKFYFYFLQSDFAKKQILLEIKGAAQPGLNSEFRHTLIAPQPSIEIQKNIVKYLDLEIEKIETLVAEKKQMLNLLEEKQFAAISRVVTKGLDENVDFKNSSIDWVEKIPEHWDIKRGKYLFVQSSLPVRDKDEIVTCFRDGQVTLRRNRREDGFTNAILELGYQGIQKGQLVLHSMDAFAGAIGVSDSDGKCSPEYIICDPISEETIDSYYFAVLLRIMSLRGYIQATCTAVRERAPRIRFSHLANMYLPLPPFTEQKAIIDFIDREKQKKVEIENTLKESIELLNERRTALITAAVTGQIKSEEMKV